MHCSCKELINRNKKSMSCNKKEKKVKTAKVEAVKKLGKSKKK